MSCPQVRIQDWIEDEPSYRRASTAHKSTGNLQLSNLTTSGPLSLFHVLHQDRRKPSTVRYVPRFDEGLGPLDILVHSARTLHRVLLRELDLLVPADFVKPVAFFFYF